ncbi:MAG TPA: hypothetical protein VGL73_09005 [Caulobacteraceae bacterium]
MARINGGVALAKSMRALGAREVSTLDAEGEIAILDYENIPPR